MRPTKKTTTTTVDESLKTITLRSGLRVEKINNSTPGRTNSSATTNKSLASASTPGGEEKRFRGPIKKRPITNISPPTPAVNSNATTTSTSSRRTISTTSSLHGKSKVIIVKKQQHPPPTIAAGRSRRSIKPNPKYTSDDILAPRSIKKVANASGDDDDDDDKSSMEDFFSEDSNDDMDKDFDKFVDKAFNDSDKEFNEAYEALLGDTSSNKNTKNSTNTMTTSTPSTVPRKRGRPRRDATNTTNGAIATPKQNNNNVNTVKNETVKNNTIGSSTTQFAQKRKLINNDKDKKEDEEVPRKRYLITSAINKYKSSNDGQVRKMTAEDERDAKIVDNNNRRRQLIRKAFAAATQKIQDAEDGDDDDDDDYLDDDDDDDDNNNNKSKELDPDVDFDDLENRNSTKKTLNVKMVAKKPNTAEVLRTRQQQQQDKQQSNLATKVAGKEDSSIKSHNVNAKNLNEQQKTSGGGGSSSSTSATVAVLEGKEQTGDGAMPTFTIVNINDIISKKGDVLISETKSTTKTTATITTTITKQTASNSERVIQAVGGAKRAQPTILNHQLANRNLLLANAHKANLKPAPRILNAMVARKTQPVKPLTANPDDSADEAFTLSLDEDEDGDVENNNTMGKHDSSGVITMLEEELEQYKIDSKKFPTRKTQMTKPVVINRGKPTTIRRNVVLPKISDKRFITSQKPGVTTVGSVNKVSPQTKTTTSSSTAKTPETVEIIKRGDKTITKVTCLENWYVITRIKQNAVNQSPQQKYPRNVLDIPLIDLANAASGMKMPSLRWNYKVTLFELPAAQLAKNKHTIFTGKLEEYKIAEEDRAKYQPSCVMFRRTVKEPHTRLPFDRAVILKNNTYFTNIEGKNVRLIGAPNTISTIEDLEVLLQIIDCLTLRSSLVESPVYST